MNHEYKKGWMSTAKLLMVLVIATFGWLWGRGFGGLMRVYLPMSMAITCMVAEVIQKEEFNWKVTLHSPRV